MKNWFKNFLEQRKMQFFDWLSLDSQTCKSFCNVVGYGYNDDGKASVGVRLCSKNRWHIDSHAYEVEYHALQGRQR